MLMLYFENYTFGVIMHELVTENGPVYIFSVVNYRRTQMY